MRAAACCCRRSSTGTCTSRTRTRCAGCFPMTSSDSNDCATFVDPGSTKFVDACMQVYADAGCRVVTGECVTDQEVDLALPRYPTDEAVQRTSAFVQKYEGTLE